MQEPTVARGFQSVSEAEKTTLLARVKDVAGDGRFELFKSSQRFDGVHHRRQHGFEVAYTPRASAPQMSLCNW